VYAFLFAPNKEKEQIIMELVNGNITNFKQYSQFKSLKDFNNNIEQWMVDYKSYFTKSELIALKRLVRFSAKVFGVSNAKINTILQAINEKENGYGISRSTFKRMVAKAKKIGMLIVKKTVRKNGSQSSNLYIFNRYTIEPPISNTEQPNLNSDNAVTSKENAQTSQKKNHYAIEPPIKLSRSRSKTNNILNKRIKMTLDYTYTGDFVPKKFINTVKPFFNDAQKIEEFWRLVKIQNYYVKYDEDKILSVAIHSFKQMIRMLKKGRVKNPFGYFWGVLNKKLDDLFFAELHELGFPKKNFEFQLACGI